MVDSVETPEGEIKTPETEAVKSHFAKAVEEAKAGAQALAGQYREKLNQKTSTLGEEAKARSQDAKGKADAFASDAIAKAGDLAVEGKAQTSKAIIRLSQVIDDNVAYIDEKAGPKYGDYVRSASKSLQDAAVRLDEKSYEELGEDAKTFVRTSPVLAVSMAVTAGYLLGRLFGKSK